ncbi:hypothetical protein [Niabella soli]|uniref:Right handed beta helix domain-containing protein n=1 Tax=Niabella soli DSM 19437 TaxID=929713 RepID=W0F6Q7_9BACT|nr:hypothetical protein [Niabella soli]AHF17061.1 hypothetical protein NIASO_01070 [Niabella soli DSM 19437]
MDNNEVPDRGLPGKVIDSVKIHDNGKISDSLKTDSTKIKDSLLRSDSIRIADSTRIADSLAKVNNPGSGGSGGSGTPAAPPPPPITNGRIITVGIGAGDLSIDGNNFVVNGAKYNFQNGDIVQIKGGLYSSITIKNVTVPNGIRVTFSNSGLVTLNGGGWLRLSNLNNVTVSGAGTSPTDRGFAFTNSAYRAVELSGSINNFTLQNMLFKNIGDYVIYYNDLDKLVYDGSAQSYRSNIAFLNLDGENINTFINLPGDISNSNFTGLLRNVEVGHISCINSPGIGIVVSLGACEDYNVHDNLINNINSQNDNHNGIFMLSGNGKFYNNTVKNHQGNAIRAWLYSVSSPKTVEIYNNIVYNSRKYSAFEVQVPPYVKASPLFKPANAKVYNNTAGQMNTSLSSFPGRLLDLYNTYGTLEFYNNLAFANNDAELINDMSDTKITVNSNNFYKAALGDAVVNSTNLNSKIPGVGAVIN